MNDEQEPKDSSQDTQRSLPQELLLLGGRVKQASRWCWKHLLRFMRGALTRARGLWSHERTRRARQALVLRAQWMLALAIGSLPSLRRATRRAFLLGGLLVLVAGSVQVGGRYCLHLIEPGTVGVRTSKWGGGGVRMLDFAPGLHLSLPGVHNWHSFPAGTKLLSWPAHSPKAPGAPLDVRTLDGTSLSLSLRVPYRIQDGMAHQIVAEGHRVTFVGRALAKAEQVLLGEFGRLRTEDFSRSDVRGELLDQALVQLNASLDEIHLVAEQILVDSVVFSAAYEKKLVETQRERQRGRVLVARQLEDQEQQTILRRRSEIDRELLERRIELDREVELVRVAGQTQAVERARSVSLLESGLRADADREHDLMLAQGEAALARAQDLERRLHGEILSGPGGDMFLALQAAKAARMHEVTLDANDPRVPSPLDVEAMVKLFGVGD